MTERQKVIKFFADKKIEFSRPVDMAMELKKDRQGENKIGAPEYVDKVLASGYKSTMSKQLMEDINKGESSFKDDQEAK